MELSIDTYLFDQYVQKVAIDTCFFDQYVQRNLYNTWQAIVLTIGM